MANSLLTQSTEIDPEFDVDKAMRAATRAAFTVEGNDGGILFRWHGDERFDFMWQTYAQARDLVSQLNKLLEQK